MNFIVPTEQILRGDQVHLYQGVSKIKLANSAELFVLYQGQGGMKLRPLLRRTSCTKKFALRCFELGALRWRCVGQPWV